MHNKFFTATVVRWCARHVAGHFHFKNFNAYKGNSRATSSISTQVQYKTQIIFDTRPSNFHVCLIISTTHVDDF